MSRIHWDALNTSAAGREMTATVRTMNRTLSIIPGLEKLGERFRASDVAQLADGPPSDGRGPTVALASALFDIPEGDLGSCQRLMFSQMVEFERYGRPAVIIPEALRETFERTSLGGVGFDMVGAPYPTFWLSLPGFRIRRPPLEGAALPRRFPIARSDDQAWGRASIAGAYVTLDATGIALWAPMTPAGCTEPSAGFSLPALDQGHGASLFLVLPKACITGAEDGARADCWARAFEAVAAQEDSGSYLDGDRWIDFDGVSGTARLLRIVINACLYVTTRGVMISAPLDPRDAKRRRRLRHQAATAKRGRAKRRIESKIAALPSCSVVVVRPPPPPPRSPSGPPTGRRIEVRHWRAGGWRWVRYGPRIGPDGEPIPTQDRPVRPVLVAPYQAGGKPGDIPRGHRYEVS